MTDVWIGPGHGRRGDGTLDPGASAGSKTEQSEGDLIVGHAAERLSNHYRLTVHRQPRGGPNFSGSITDINARRPRLAVEVHHEWSGGPRGGFAVGWDFDTLTREAAIAIHQAYGGASLPIRKHLKFLPGKRSYPAIVRRTKPTTVLWEADRIGSVNDHQRYGHVIADGIAAFLRATASGAGAALVAPNTTSVPLAQGWARSSRAHDRFVNEIIPALADAGASLRSANDGRGIDLSVLVAQAAKETGWGRFGGVIDASFHNTAGIKIAAGGANDDPHAHERFPSWAEGARAHANHLAAYTGLKPVGTPHGRYHVVIGLAWAGRVATVEGLGARWAPNPAYGQDIARMIASLQSLGTPEEQIVASGLVRIDKSVTVYDQVGKKLVPLDNPAQAAVRVKALGLESGSVADIVADARWQRHVINLTAADVADLEVLDSADALQTA